MASLLVRNVHNIERAVRIVFGLALLSQFFIGAQAWWGLIGLVPLLTGALGTCPLYTLLGMSTCPVSTRGSNA